MNETQKPEIRILVAEDHPIVVDGIMSILAKARDMVVVVGNNSIRPLKARFAPDSRHLVGHVWLAKFLASVCRGPVEARRHLVLENAAMGHQLLVLSRKTKQPHFHPLDRLFWVYLSVLSGIGGPE